MNRPVNLFWSESSHYFGANSPVRNFERNVPEESSREELVLEQTVPEPSRRDLFAGSLFVTGCILLHTGNTRNSVIGGISHGGNSVLKSRASQT